MEFKNLDLKDTKQFKGETILDLSEPTLVIDPESRKFKVTKLFLVDEHYAMRPDLISFAVYGTPDYVDILLKANQISNPFSIDIGDILIIIDKNLAQEFYKKPKKPKKDIADTKSLFLDRDRASQKDISRIENLQKIADKKSNGASKVKPTNLKRPGEDTFTFSGGNIAISSYKTNNKIKTGFNQLFKNTKQNKS
jgi:hypothetical protein